MKRAAIAFFAATLLLSERARADDAPSRSHGRFCAMTGLSFTTMNVFGVAVRGFDVPVGIGGCRDGEHFGYEIYGTGGFGFGETNAGRLASSGSLFGARVVARFDVVRFISALGVTTIAFETANGLTAGNGSQATMPYAELGLGVDLFRLFAHSELAEVQETLTLDVSMRGFVDSIGPMIVVGVGGHL